MESLKRSIGLNLSALIEANNTTQSAIASVAQATKGAVSQWISGRSKPGDAYLERIAEYYGVSIDDLTSAQNGLYAKSHGLTEAPPGALAPSLPKPAYAPLYGRVHAGDASEPDVLNDSIPIPYEIWKGHQSGYFLEVEGDCMNKVYPEGCHVFIDPEWPPADNSIAVVSIDGEDHIIRRLKIGANTLMLVPESSNPKWEDMQFSKDSEHEVSMVGTVIWFQAREEME